MPDDARIELPDAPRAAGVARNFVRHCWADLGSETLDSVTLCVSELVTNAIDHATSPYKLRLNRSRQRLRVEVEDASAGKPEMKAVSPAAPRGRGMFIVSQLATRWGVDVLGRGKTVWAEFSTNP